MPGLLKSNDNRVALCCHPRPQQQEHLDQNGVSNENPDALPQPRQSRGLQGLLRFAMETTGADDGAGPSNLAPIDDERRKFLEDALKSMTIDVIEVLLKQIKVFDNVSGVTETNPATEYVEAFYTILEYIDHADVANDFYKIGGFTIFDPCLKSPNAKIKAGACELIAELCQNNPFCQMIVIDNDFLPVILDILDKDEDEDVCVKALYALSCIIRENIDGCYKFLELDGMELILKTIKKNNDKLRTKSAFFLDALCRMKGDIVEKLITLSYIPVLINILSEEHLPSHEHVVSLMKTMIENSSEAVDICKNPVNNLQQILKENYDFIKDKDECYEELEYCQYILNRLFPGWDI